MALSIASDYPGYTNLTIDNIAVQFTQMRPYASYRATIAYTYNPSTGVITVTPSVSQFLYNAPDWIADIYIFE